MTLHVETAVDPATLAGPVLAEVRRLDAATPVQDVQTMQHFFREGALFGNRLVTQVVTVIGLFGLLLAITGLYGVIAYSVSRRTREIGIRMAIGADPCSVAWLVLRQGMKLTAIGGAIGLVLSLLASQVLGSLLVGVSARDPEVYVAVPLLLAAISLLACYVPARRAARVDPRCSPGGNIACQQADGGQQQRYGNVYLGVPRADANQQAAQNLRCQQRQHQADCASDGRQLHALPQDQPRDRTRIRADGHSNPDLTRAPPH